MRKYLILVISIFIFIGCTSNNPQVGSISKVYELDYPEGISVVLYDELLRNNIKIQSARLVNGKYKKQVQFMINNQSANDFNIKVSHEWTNSRGILQNSAKSQGIRLAPNSAKRVILNAPNFKAKDVMINIGCASNCINKSKK